MSGERHIDFPWIVDAEMSEHNTYGFDTQLGRASIFTALFSDGTNVIAQIDPRGNARFARLAPETGFALEERFVGESPDEIREAVDQGWRTLMSIAAETNRETREALEQGSQ